MSNQKRWVNVVNLPTEFLLASSNFRNRELGSEEAKAAIVEQLHDLAEQIEAGVVLRPEVTRSGVYRIGIIFQRKLEGL